MIQEGQNITIEMDEDYMLEIDVTVEHLGSGPTWSEWDGGHPGDPIEYKITEIRLQLEEDDEEPDPGPLTKEQACKYLEYTVEEFDDRLYREVEDAICHSAIPEHDYVYTPGGYRI
ncbi:MAG: hypothetical protein GF334_10295 [Candidatus Altiarchaeales archaeon]|nr:hypothetical protein [Candidatus Altiarchaeales archaeon]